MRSITSEKKYGARNRFSPCSLPSERPTSSARMKCRGRKPCSTRCAPTKSIPSAFDDVDLDGFDFDPGLLQPLNGSLDVRALAFQFEANDPNLVGNTRLA